MGAVSVDQRAPIGPLPVGAKLGRYEILGKLAAGGMAIVYVARAQGVAGFERLVAIKVLHSNLAHEEEFIKMFLDEARLAASIRHPNVVPTIDISDSEKSGYFIVMEYIEGDHLGQLLSSANKVAERLPIRVTLRVIGDALGGLAAAHDLRDESGNKVNLVHRDVSPHNIMVGRDGVARLTDFGVAKAEDRLTHTRDGQVKGKLAYMAPEQAASGTTDTRSDLFSMGVILWECLTGQRLMRAESTAATLHKLLHGEIPKPSTIAPELVPLDALLAKALARDPDDRYPTAEEFARALEDVSSVFAGAASLREVSRVVKHHAAGKLKRDKKLIDDALKALRPAGVVPDSQSGIFTDETSSPTTPSEISIVAGSPSLISKVSSLSAAIASETMPGTRRATRRTQDIPIPAQLQDRKLDPPLPLGASDSQEVLVSSGEPESAGAHVIETANGVDPGAEPVTRNILGPREQVGADEPPVIVSSMLEDPALQIEIASARMPEPMGEAMLAFSDPPPNRKLRIAVFAVGAAALGLVILWASSTTQEVVHVQEMGAVPLDGTGQPAKPLTTTPTLASSVTQPEPGRAVEPRAAVTDTTIPAGARREVAPERVKAAAQQSVPVVPSAASSAQPATTATGRSRSASSSIRSSEGAIKSSTSTTTTTKVPTVRRHREAAKPIAQHLDVIPNPYHD
ncbi:MAG TPA: serine/threonine-protein kinase [Polyangiales bacterium]|nr:serine/threonine-protein kinase [Polyangiales bacterium]